MAEPHTAAIMQDFIGQQQAPPMNYRRRDGSLGRRGVPLGDWPWPECWAVDDDRIMLWHPSCDWLHLGWCPAPRGHLGWMRHHLLHGLLMGYPLLDVVVWSWRHRRLRQRTR